MRSQFEGWAWNGPRIPNHKPAFSSLVPDRSERVWVGREGPGIKQEGCAEDPFEDEHWWLNPCWRSETSWEVFQMAGEYLGEVEVPEGLRISPAGFIEDEVIIAEFTDEYGVPFVKRYRLVPPSDQE